MSELTDHSGPPSDDQLAAEYVLGVLTQAEREAVTRRMTQDRAFAGMVANWENRLVPWTQDIAPVQPSHDVWNRITASLPPERAGVAGWWSSLNLWRGLAGAASAAALACAIALVVLVRAPTAPPLVASIAASSQGNFVATIDPARGAVVVVPAAYAADPGRRPPPSAARPEPERVPELWLIAPNEKPRSLGLLDPRKPVTLAIPENLRAFASDQAVLAISLEPPGGSKTGAPTGPVIGQAKLTSL